MQKTTISHPSALRLFWDLIDLIPETSKGTYNRADPTAYSKGNTKCQGLYLKYSDNTWGIDLEIWSCDGKSDRGIYLAGIGLYDKELIPRKGWSNTWLPILHQVRKKLERTNQRKSQQDYIEMDEMPYYC